MLQVVINHVSDTRVEEAKAALLEAGAAECANFPGDISKKEVVDALIKFTTDTFGSLDIMVNNAGHVPSVVVPRDPAQ